MGNSASRIYGEPDESREDGVSAISLLPENRESKKSPLLRMASKFDPPRSAAGIPIQAGNDAFWNMYCDDYGNPYYYNSETCESTWDPPPQIADTPAAVGKSISVVVIVPEGARENEIFSVDLYDRSIEVLCPVGAMPGMSLELFIAKKTSGCNSCDMPDVAPAGNETYTDQSYKPTEKIIFSHAPSDTTAPTVVDLHPSEAWERLAYYDSSKSIDRYILDDKNMLFQLDWAYKMSLLETALLESFKVNGDLMDSSPYDNCKGIPAYRNRGFFEWYADLHRQRQAVDKELEKRNGHDIVDDLFEANLVSDAIALFDQCHISLTPLRHGQELSPNQESLTGRADEPDELLTRYRVIELTINEYIARLRAIVSLPNGPQKAALDEIHMFIKDNFNGDTDDDSPLWLDELEEVVANAVQPKHRFCADIILDMVSLEVELEHLQSEIWSKEEGERSALSDASNQRSASASDGSGPLLTCEERGDGAGEYGRSEWLGCESNGYNDGATPMVDAFQPQRLQEELRDLEKRMVDTHMASLKELIAMQRLADAQILEDRERRLAQLKQTVQKRGATTSDGSPASKLMAAAEVEREISFIEEATNEKLRKCRFDFLSELRRRSIAEEVKLTDILENDKKVKLKNLQKRLYKRREAKRKELDDDPEFAAAAEALDLEAGAISDVIVADCERILRDTSAAIAKAVTNEHEIEISRLESSLNAERSRKKESLARRLQAKLQKRARELSMAGEMETSPESKLTPAEAVMIATSEIEGEEAAEMASIEASIVAARETATAQLLASMKEIQERELSRLSENMHHSEQMQKDALRKKLEAKARVREEQRRIDTHPIGADLREANDSARTPRQRKSSIDNDDEQSKAELESSLDALKSKYKEEAAKLKDYLSVRRASTNAKLNARLTTRKKAKEQQEQTISADTALVTEKIKIDLKSSIARLKALVRCEKREQMRKAAGTKQQAQCLMLFSVLDEYLVAGLKKKSLYELKYAASTTNSVDDSPAEVALQQLMKRLPRDIVAVVDSLENQRDKLEERLTESVAQSHIADAELSYQNSVKEGLWAEILKAISCAAGIFIEIKDLMKKSATSTRNKKLGDANNEVDDNDDDEDIDEDEVDFDASIRSWFTSLRLLLTEGEMALDSFLSHLVLAEAEIIKISVGNNTNYFAPMEPVSLHSLSRQLHKQIVPVVVNIIIEVFVPGVQTLLARSDVPLEPRVLEVSLQQQMAAAKDQHLSDVEIIGNTIQAALAQLAAGVPRSMDITVDSIEQTRQAYASNLEDYFKKPFSPASFVEGLKQRASRMFREASSILREGFTQAGSADDTVGAPRPLDPIASASTSSHLSREDIVIKTLSTKLSKRLSEALEKDIIAARLAAESKSTSKRVLHNTVEAIRSRYKTQTDYGNIVVAFINDMLRSLSRQQKEEITADALCRLVEKKVAAAGTENAFVVDATTSITLEEVLLMQKELDDEANSAQVRLIIQQQEDQREKLGLALKVQQAKDQQSRQQRQSRARKAAARAKK